MKEIKDTIQELEKIINPGWNGQVEVISILLDQNYAGNIWHGHEKWEIDEELNRNQTIRN